MSKNEDEVDFDQLREQLERLSRLIRQQGFEDGLNPVQWEALRYVARSNRFSNSPSAMAHYLGSTKGTVSQTILSLEKKGLLEKQPSPADARVVLLVLTTKGRELLAKDPLLALGTEIVGLSGKTVRRFAKAVTEILMGEVKRQKQNDFGGCKTCRHWRDRSGDDALSICMYFNQKMTKPELNQLCFYHLPR